MTKQHLARLTMVLPWLALAYGLAMWQPVRDLYAPPLDKPAHALAFGLVYAGLAWATRWRPVSLAALTAVLGAAVEVQQFFMPGFHPQLSDWLADLVGIAVVMGMHLWRRRGRADEHTETDELPPGMLDAVTFRTGVKALPLVSVDWVLTNPAGELLLGHRLNAPARGTWFTPGGRMRKGEPLARAQVRVAMDELGLPAENARALARRATLMGAWDHFYADAAFSPTESTHYVNLPFAARLTEDDVQALRLPVGQQHGHWQWLAPAAALPLVHPYVQPYVQWWVQHGAKTDTH